MCVPSSVCSSHASHYVCHELSVCVSCQLHVGILALNVHTVDWEIFPLKIICGVKFLQFCLIHEFFLTVDGYSAWSVPSI